MELEGANSSFDFLFFVIIHSWFVIHVIDKVVHFCPKVGQQYTRILEGHWYKIMFSNAIDMFNGINAAIKSCHSYYWSHFFTAAILQLRWLTKDTTQNNKNHTKQRY